MYSWLLRFIYSFTYYIHIGIVAYIYQISKHGLIPLFRPDQTIEERVLEVIQIHYPLIIIILCIIIAQSMVKGAKKLASYTMQMESSESFGIEILYTGIQIVPYLTFAFREQLFGIWGALALLIVTIPFLVSHGTYNLTLLLLGYRQYKLKTDNSTIWLVSKRKISNFSNSELVHTLQDNVFVKHE